MNARTDLDLSHLWMPFTANKQFKAQPRMLTAAKGMYYTSGDGRQVLDGTAGLWCVNAGHGRPEIAEAIAAQAAAAQAVSACGGGKEQMTEEEMAKIG